MRLMRQLRNTRFCFSALQRAENSSIYRNGVPHAFLCRFSALQRAENSSICDAGRRVGTGYNRVSVLFSEPKIPQSERGVGE